MLQLEIPNEVVPYLAGPNPFYDEAIVLKDIENLYKAPGVSEDGDAGVGYGQV